MSKKGVVERVKDYTENQRKNQTIQEDKSYKGKQGAKRELEEIKNDLSEERIELLERLAKEYKRSELEVYNILHKFDFSESIGRELLGVQEENNNEFGHDDWFGTDEHNHSKQPRRGKSSLAV